MQDPRPTPAAALNGQREPTAPDPGLWAWGWAATAPRLLHTMLRVRDLERALTFYCEGLGMQVISAFDSEPGRFSLRFVAYTDFATGPAIELTHNWDRTEPYTHGSGYGHVAIGVPDIHAMCARLVAAGGTVTTPPRCMVPGAPALALVQDPDGHAIELIQTRHG